LSKPIIHGAPSPGVEAPANVAAHGARSSIRRLVAGLFDAWDAGDAAAFAAGFAGDGVWEPEAAAPATGASPIAARFVECRKHEPWTLHWLSNESVLVDGDGAGATWLWSAASTLDAGTTSAWSGGDLAVTAVETPAGWRVARLARTARYRTPVDVGWLAAPIVPLFGASGAAPPTSAHPPSLGLETVAPPGPFAGNDAELLADLVAESALRRLMADHVHGTETDATGRVLAERWTPGGAYRLITPPTDDGASVLTSVSGRADIAAVLDQQRVTEKAWIRALSSEWIAVHGDRATGRWRDLCTADVNGQARWWAHHWCVTAEQHEGIWAFAEVTRRRLLDVGYGARWTIPGAPAHDGRSQ
jgi:uncharacterized protein (TIGR02246 family)